MKRPRSSSGEAPRWGAEEADGAAASTSGAQAKPMSDELELSLQVKWTSGTGTSQGPGKTRITRLMLKPLEDVDRLGAVPATRKESTPAENGRLKRNSQHSTLHVGHVCLFSDNPDLVSSSVPPAAGGLSKGLMDRAFPAESRPNYLTDDLFYRWTPHETCLSYPLDVANTEFKLIAKYNGWEYVILKHEVGINMEQPDRALFVTVIEFESVAVVLGNLGIRISLVAYPVVCVQKLFLDDVRQQLKHNSNFKGILS
mmetsp:Transcript_17481/g.52549  ORF Transcript_17481/g.52549 Transcript_17481/m.52549 type:complete len:256 (-) Transcript_17481:438-1205(-)